MRMVRGYLRRADLGQDSRTCDSHKSFLVVQSEDLCADVLDARVNHVESVLARIYIRDDPVIHINEGFFCALDAQKHAIQ